MATRVKRIQQATSSNSLNKGSTILTTIGTGLAVAILESELVPGMLLGAAVALLPQIEPGSHTHTIVKSAIRSRLKTRIKSRGAHQDNHQESFLATAMSAAAVAIIEPQLLPGMAVGAAVSLLPAIMPVAQKAVWPIIKTSVKAGYITVKETRNLVLNVGEQLQEIVTEVREEQKARSLSGN